MVPQIVNTDSQRELKLQLRRYITSGSKVKKLIYKKRIKYKIRKTRLFLHMIAIKLIQMIVTVHAGTG